MKKTIKLCLFLFLVFSFPVKAKDLPYDGFLRLYHSHTDEFLEVQYEKNGTVNQEAILKIKHLMRSRDSGKEIDIDLNLLRLLDHLQDHFGADTVEVICGYRSPEYNEHLKKTGHNVAENSNHMKGIAADIHLDEIPEDVLQKYVRSLKKGGVGYYPDLLMVHVDLGEIKFWQEDKFSNRLNIGIFNKASSLKLTTDKLFYFFGDKMVFKKANFSKKEVLPQWDLEWFYRGKWQIVGKFDFGTIPSSLTFSSMSKAPDKNWIDGDKLHLSRFGKYRWKITASDGGWQYSNEFYLKRK